MAFITYIAPILLIFLAVGAVISTDTPGIITAYAQTPDSAGPTDNSDSFDSDVDTAKMLFHEANQHFYQGEYGLAIRLYDNILEIFPENISTLVMKSMAQTNLGYHNKALVGFLEITLRDPDNARALAGAGLNFGYLGEYAEAKKYFVSAQKVNPNSTVIQNYITYLDKTMQKYPNAPTTPKPKQLLVLEDPDTILSWARDNARLWSEDRVRDSEFMSTIQRLVSTGIINITTVSTTTSAHRLDTINTPASTAPTPNPPLPSSNTNYIPHWVKTTAKLWANDQITREHFLQIFEYLLNHNIVRINYVKTDQQIQQEINSKSFALQTYVYKIHAQVLNEKRYIEFPNPSQDVIKKFLRDYVKWNFEGQAQHAADQFPDPTFEIVDDIVIIRYSIFVNEQPAGLPLNHVRTLEESIAYWESQILSINDKKARIKFFFTDSRESANVWITWVVRNLGEGVLGHAHLGKGIVEVTLGDYNCDGSFQLYDVSSVESIMRHELGHSIGLSHVDVESNIMYPSYRPQYAYCLLR